MVQIIPELHHITNTHQVHKYPDSSISKVLTILKWQMTTTLKRKLLEKQRVQNCFASYEKYIGHFLQCQCYCQYSDLKIFHWTVCGVCHSALQSFKCVCVECGHTCVYTKLTFHLHTLGTAVLSSLHSGVVVHS